MAYPPHAYDHVIQPLRDKTSFGRLTLFECRTVIDYLTELGYDIVKRPDAEPGAAKDAA